MTIELAREEVQPVAWMYVNADGECEQIEYGEVLDDPSVTPLYTAPPQREWQGLTDEERTYLAWESNNGIHCVAMTEAKLKEKNT